MEWIKFFLQCIIDSSNQAIKRIKEAVDERSKIGRTCNAALSFRGGGSCSEYVTLLKQHLFL